MTRTKNALALASVMGSLCLGATTAQADAPLRVRWDCYLEDAAVDCNALANAYAEATPGVVLDADDAELEVHVRSTEVAPRRRYVVEVRSSRTTEEPATRAVTDRLRLARDVASTRGEDQTLLDVLALLQRATLPFLEVGAPGRVEDGVLTLRAGAPSASSSAPASEPSTWFFRPTLSGQIVSAGVRVYGLGGGLELSRSTPRHRVRVVGDASYRYVDFTLPSGESLRGGLVRAGGSVVGARSLGRGVSVAVLGNAQRQPQNNLELRADLGLGLEWLRAPFLATDGTNFGVRYRVRATHDRYVVETTQGHATQTYPHHTLGVVGLAHYDAIDLSLDLALGAPLLEPSLWDVRGNASVTFRVAGALEIGVGATFVIRGGAIHEPGDRSALDPVATLLAGSDFGRLTVEAELSLAYTFGNGALRTEDRRWR
jgi:hypothetical protein